MGFIGVNLHRPTVTAVMADTRNSSSGTMSRSARMYRRKLKLKPKLESSSSHFTFKR